MSSWLSFILLTSLCLFFNGVSGARQLKERNTNKGMLRDWSLPIGPGGGMLPPLPVPDLGIPTLVPSLPGVPLPPNTSQKPSKTNKLTDQKVFGLPFPPNPLQPPTLPPLPFVPPPQLLPPLPFQPPPPSVLPPIFPTPPPASLFPPLPFPPVPSLIPSPPPPPPPAFPIPLPPIPLIPGVPPVPPASSSDHVGRTTP